MGYDNADEIRMTLLWPADFRLPETVAFGHIRARLLSTRDLPAHLAAHATAPGFAACIAPDSRPWPADRGLRTALAHLGYCEWERYRRSSAWYGTFDEVGAEIGGFGVTQGAGGFDAGLVGWMRGGIGTDDELIGRALGWLKKEWGFERVGLPGRSESWDGFGARPLVPAAFEYPGDARFEGCTVRMLTMDDLARDYTAYMGNIAHIAGTLQGPSFSSGWPHPGIRLDLAFSDVCWSEWQHLVPREQFSLGVYSPDGSEEVGCLYLSATGREDYDVEVTFWFVESASRRGFDERFPGFVRGWLRETWPFERPAFPGREIPWGEWLRG